MKQKSRSYMISGVTNNFKMGLITLIFLITGFHLLEIVFIPDAALIQNKVLLSIVLSIAVFLWIQELQEKKRFEILYEELVSRLKEPKDFSLTTVATMKALVMSEEARDPYLTGHSQRVTEYALAIADRLNLSDEERRHIEHAGYLHDIGKISISDTILHKKEKLDDEEWKIIKQHPVIALDILAPLDFLPEKIIIKHHHERYDGNGYPDGLRGEEIPLGSRILAISDSFDAMNSIRPYRPPLSKDRIIEEIKTARGTQFDPKIVDVFLEMLKSNVSFFRR